VARTHAADILGRRLQAQQLAAATFTDPTDVVAWMGAVQAQDYLGALWAVGARTAAATERDVERALAEGTIVRSWPMRGTLHFMASRDARWMIDLLAPRALAAARSRLRSMGVDAPTLSRARRALAARLEGGRRLTRPATYDVLERAGIATKAGRGLHVLWCLAHEALLCFGPREGKQPTFVLLEEWVPRAERVPRDEALARLAHRYFAGHGPATLHDFAWWSGLRLDVARAGVTGAGSARGRETIDGREHWFASAPPAKTASRRAIAHALPAFDELFVGYADRRAGVDPAHLDRLTPFDVLGPVVVVGGRLVARWKRVLTRDRVRCTLSPLDALGDAESRPVHRALERYARFLGRALEGGCGRAAPPAEAPGVTKLTRRGPGNDLERTRAPRGA
jgi:hypothetical protein